MSFNAITNAQSLSASYGGVFYICADSTISAIGNNYGYQLGDGTDTERHYPVKVKGLHNVVSVDGYGSLALLSDGSVWQWSQKNKYELKKVNIDSVVYLSSGCQYFGKFHCAIKKDGTLWLWGDQDKIEPDWWWYTDSFEKMDLPKVIKVQGGFDCVVALCEDGSVWTWGYEFVEGNGNLVYYPNGFIRKPQKVKSLSNVIDIGACGYETAWAVKDDGSIWEWGSMNQAHYPQKIYTSSIKSIYTAKGCGDPGTYALKNDGSLFLINGLNWDVGRTDTIRNINNIVAVASTTTNDDISTYVLDGNRSLWRWGNNTNGQLGNFTTFPIESPEISPRPCVAVNCDTITKNPDVVRLDTAVYPGVNVKLKASLSEADLYWWYPRSAVVGGIYKQDAIVKIKDSTEFSSVIMDSYGCMRKERFVLRKKCDPNIRIRMDSITYPGAKIVLKADSGSYFSWSPSSNLSCSNCRRTTSTVNNFESYSVSYTDTMACPAEEKFIIRIRDCDTIIKNNDILKLDSLILPGSSTKLEASNAKSYHWLPIDGLNCDTCQTPIARIYGNTEYSVLITDKYLCEWKERFKLTNNCDSSTIKNPTLMMDTITWPTSKINFSLPITKGYYWQPSTELSCTNCANPVATITDSITYIACKTDSFNCISKASYKIRIRNCDTIQLNNQIVRLDTTLYYTSELPLIASKSYDGYKWNPIKSLSCSECQVPILTAHETSNYSVVIADQWRCPYSEIFKISIIYTEVIIPNVFTPNGDGVNDYFEIKGLIPGSNLKIYDNNSKLVFSSENYQGNWDGLHNNGKQMEEGTYWYLLTVPESGTYKGWVYLKR